MTLLIDGLSWVSLVAGGLLVIVGALGVLRLPDLYTRMHAAGITDTLGTWLVLLGLALQAGPTQVTVKLALILVFLFFTSPTSTHALARAALHSGPEPLQAGPGGGAEDEPS